MTDPITARATTVMSQPMQVTPPATAADVTADPAKDRALRKTAQELEGLFVQQLFKAMRETVPQQEGIVSGGAGEDMFTGLLDQHLAAETPNQWEGGLAEAVYRQLRGRLPVAPSPTPPSSTTR